MRQYDIGPWALENHSSLVVLDREQNVDGGVWRPRYYCLIDTSSTPFFSSYRITFLENVLVKVSRDVSSIRPCACICKIRGFLEFDDALVLH